MAKTVYIDPGHGESIRGAYDPGAVGPSGTRENDVALDIANRCAHLLREKGITVLGNALGRPDRESYKEAVYAANAAGVDFFLSIHLNAAVNHAAGGYEVLYRTSIMTAQKILDEIGRQVVNGKSKWLQAPVNLRNRGKIRRTDLFVLNATRMPAVLVEVAFISNPREEALLADKFFRQAMAQALADGVAKSLQG